MKGSLRRNVYGFAAACVALWALGTAVPAWAAEHASTITMPAELVHDKIRGGLLGHLLGDLNGLQHEMKYIAGPGNVTAYTPGLPKGAWTDDDTDFEWVYIVEMHRRGRTLLSPSEIAGLWKAHINRFFWCANQYARQLMDLGIEPPLTGMVQFNPWSDFNISGQFVSESWGLISPGMPVAAARIGLNYTRVTISGEPAQTTQLFDAMIATAFLRDDLNTILDAGLAAIDSKSLIHQVVSDVRGWHRQYPQDWRTIRRLVKEKYSRFNGAMRDKNGYELNTASVIGALLYGQGDYIRTSIAAFNFGWDADNNAATACTIIGVIKGANWMKAQGWEIKDEYRNTSRDQMPMDETITRFGDRLIALADLVITERGGKKFTRGGKDFYSIPGERATNVEPLPDGASNYARLQMGLRAEIEKGLQPGSSTQTKARAFYQAICLGLADSLRAQSAENWTQGLAALQAYPKVLGVLFYESDTPAGRKLQARATAAGLQKPEKRIKIW